MKARAAPLLTACVLLLQGCGSDKASSPTQTGASSFSETRSAILAAVDSGDYDALRPLIEAETFLSDFGFGEEQDPVGRWEAMGSKPLETMGVLLRMSGVVRKTNEGTLHQWPSYDADSKPGDLTSKDRQLFEQVLSKDELEQALTDEYGYIGPRLGILADGTWWFFILEGGP
jgi:hypothetical protein